jgi:AP-5 complex subunit zeta-1
MHYPLLLCSELKLFQLSLKHYTVLVVALEKVERSSGTLIGSSIATIQKSAAPEVIFRMI